MASKNAGVITPRNPVVRSPLMRKGGVHEKSKTAKRQINRQSLNVKLDDWREEVEFERSLRSDSIAYLVKSLQPKSHGFTVG